MAPVTPAAAPPTAPSPTLPLPSWWEVPPAVEVPVVIHTVVEVVEVPIVVVGADHWNGFYVVLGILLKVLQDVTFTSHKNYK